MSRNVPQPSTKPLVSAKVSYCIYPGVLDSPLPSELAVPAIIIIDLGVKCMIFID